MLVFLVELAEFAHTMVTMKLKDAKKALVSLPKKLEEGRGYLQEHLLQLMIKSQSN